VNERPDDGRVAIFAALSTGVRGGAIFHSALFAERLLPLARKESAMRQLKSLLRSAPSRIGRRFALIVAIAAASLPSAGA
jgi:hypothetical protein